MNDQVLILPDGGVDFMRTVRLASLYAETVHVYPPTKQSTIDSIAATVRIRQIWPALIQQFLSEKNSDKPPDFNHLLKRITKDPDSKATFRQHLSSAASDHPVSGFLRASVANRSDLELLNRESVLKSIFDDVLPNLRKPGDSLTALMDGLQSALKEADRGALSKMSIPDMYLGKIGKAHPSVCLLFEFLIENAISMLDDLGKLPDEILSELYSDELLDAMDSDELLDEMDSDVFEGAMESYNEKVKTISIGLYFLMSSYYALQNGCVGMTWDGETQQFFDMCSEALTSGTSNGNQLIAKREFIKNRLGEVILKDQVPDVSDLPIEEILKIRHKRDAELKSFRDSLRQLAADIDPHLDDNKIVLALDSKLHKVVRPALNDLRASVSELQIEAYRRLLSPDNSLVAGGVTFAISSLAGMPSGLPLSLGAVGILISKLYDFTIGKHLEKKKLLVSSPWSVVFHLKERTINKRH